MPIRPGASCLLHVCKCRICCASAYIWRRAPSMRRRRRRAARMWRRRPTGAPWRMATPSSAARMVRPMLAVSLAATSLWHAVPVQSSCAATAHRGPKYSAAPAGPLPCFCSVGVWSCDRAVGMPSPLQSQQAAWYTVRLQRDTMQVQHSGEAFRACPEAVSCVRRLAKAAGAGDCGHGGGAHLCDRRHRGPLRRAAAVPGVLPSFPSLLADMKPFDTCTLNVCEETARGGTWLSWATLCDAACTMDCL